MTALLLTLTVLAAAVCWVCASPARLAAAGVAVFLAHPAPTLAVTALVAAGLSVAAGVLVYRVLRAEGWHLVTVQRPRPAPVPAGGVAA